MRKVPGAEAVETVAGREHTGRLPACRGSAVFFMDRFGGNPPATGGGLRFEVIQDEVGLGRLRDAWAGLLADAHRPILFLSWDWVCGWWQRFGGDNRLWVLAAYDGEWLVGVFPLMVSRISRRYLHWKELVMIAAEFGADHLDMLVRRGYEETVPAGMLAYLSRNYPEVDLFDLKGLDANGLCVAAARQRPGEWVIEQGGACPFVQLAASWEDYTSQGLDKQVALKLRSSRQRLATDTSGTFRIWQVKNEREREMALNSLFEMHCQKWAERGEVSIFADPRLRAFHQEMSAGLLKCGCLRMFVMSVGRTVVAVEYDVRCRDICYSFQKSFAPAWRDHHPGYLVTQFAIQRSIQEGLSGFDLLRGDEAYKQSWATDIRHDVDLWRAVSAMGRIVRLAARVKHRLEAEGNGR